MTGVDVPAGGRRPARRPLAARTIWETIPPRAVVRPGDVLRFSWTPHGWTRPIRVVGMVHCAAPARRTWFVAVDKRHWDPRAMARPETHRFHSFG